MKPNHEEDIHEAFASLAEEQKSIRKAYIRENLGKLGASDWMDEWFDITGFRTHEIDVLLVRSGNKIEAIEIKHFPSQSESSNHPKGSYYRGISQAISLTRTGVDYVSLHHYFDPEIRPLDINTYGKTVHDLRNWHDLPFDYRCLRLIEGEFAPVQIHPQKASPDELTERANGIDFRAGSPNPLLQDPTKNDAERARQYLKRVLEIPD